MRVSGIIPAYTLKMPLPKQLQKKRMLRTTKPILHSIVIMINPEMPMYAGITYLRIIAFCQRSSCSKPYMQQKTENARNDPPTTRLRILRIQVTSERSSLSLRILELVFLLSTRSSIALEFISESFCNSPSFESFLLSMKIFYQLQIPQIHSTSTANRRSSEFKMKVGPYCCYEIRTIFIINFMMQNDQKMQVFVFEEQQEEKEEEIVEESQQEEREQKMEKDMVNESPVQIDCFQGDFYPIQSPSFQATTQRGKPAVVSVNPVIQTQDRESKQSNFLFLQQNAYSFRKNDLQAVAETTKNVLNQLQIISDFHSQTSNNEGLLQEEQRQVSMRSHKEQSVKRISSRRSMKKMNEDSSAKSYKTKEKLQDEFASKKLVPNMMTSLQQSNRTEDNINQQSNPKSILFPVDSSLNQAVKRRRQNQSPLVPIQPEKSGQVFINTSGIIQNETSFNSLSMKGDPFKMASLSSLTHMANSQDEQQKFAEKVVPEHRVVKCTFKREKQCFSNYYYPQYSFLFKNSKFIANARKQFAHINSHYNITASPQQYGEDSQHFLGFLKGNFFGSQFNLYQYINNVNELVCTILYQSQFSCSPTFRKMEIYIKDQKCLFSSLFGSSQVANLKDLYELGKNAEQKKIVKLINKKPEWSEKLDSYFLDLKGNCKYASVKNMVLISQQTPKKYNLLCCKTESNQFHTQICYPLSPFIAMGIILSSFDFKLCCQ